MPERRGARRLGGALAVAALGALVTMPAALGQSEEPTVSDTAAWAASAYTEPFVDGEATVTTESFPISGRFVKQRDVGEQIVRVTVSFDDPDAEDDPGSTTTTSTPEDPTAEDPTGDAVRCLPEDPPSFVGAGETDDETASYSFSVPGEQSTWPCNGRYVVTAAAQSNQEPGPYTLVGVLTVAVPPLPVTVVEATADDGGDGAGGEPSTVEIRWEPLAPEDRAVDAMGYRVERAGPATDDRFRGYAPIADVGLEGEPIFVDTLEAGGAYRYRVRAVRDGADGPVLSPVNGTAVAEVTVAGDPAATTTTTAGGGTSPRLGNTGPIVPRPSTTPQLPAPPATVDPGFDETLEYDQPPFGQLASPGLVEAEPAEGQSVIINEEDDGGGVGILVPAAGALVLLGWAGHVAYLNRLAKQF
jgi:hypothetical protein